MNTFYQKIGTRKIRQDRSPCLLMVSESIVCILHRFFKPCGIFALGNFAVPDAGDGKQSERKEQQHDHCRAEPLSACQRKRCGDQSTDSRRSRKPGHGQDKVCQKNCSGKGQCRRRQLPHIISPHKTGPVSATGPIFLSFQIIFSPSFTPPSRWKCRCITVCPPSSPQLLMTR